MPPHLVMLMSMADISAVRGAAIVLITDVVSKFRRVVQLITGVHQISPSEHDKAVQASH